MQAPSGTAAVSNILFRDTGLPTSATKRYHPLEDGQLVTEIEVFENDAFEGEEHSAFEDSVCIGTFRLKLPDNVSKDASVSVKFTVSSEGILTAEAECRGHRGTCILTCGAVGGDRP